MKTTAFCEQDEYCQKVLKKHWPDVPIHNDIRELDGTQYRGAVDVVCGGFPCQPFSQAGKRAGKNDDRDLWPEMFRIIQEVQPSRVIGENVAGFVDMELDRTLADLEGSGYACQTFEIPACAVAAPHQRMRVWIVAYRNSDGLRKQQKPGPRSNSAAKSVIDGAARSLANASGIRCGESTSREIQQPRGAALIGSSENMADPESQRRGEKGGDRERSKERAASSRATRSTTNASGEGLEGQQQPSGAKAEHAGLGDPCRWEPESGICRVADGVPNRAHRLRALGNAVVPQIPEIIGRAIMAL